MEDRAKIADLIMGFVPAQAVAVAAELGIAGEAEAVLDAYDLAGIKPV